MKIFEQINRPKVKLSFNLIPYMQDIILYTFVNTEFAIDHAFQKLD